MTVTQDEAEAGQLPAFVTDPRGVLRRRWHWMAGVVAIGVVATAVFVASIPVTYLASATLLVSDQQIPEQFVSVTVPSDPLDRVDALVGEILSRERLAPLVEKHKLYAELRGKTAMLDLVALARTNIGVGPADVVAQKRRGGPPASVYAIAFRDGNPKVAADVANDLATLFTAATTRIRGQQARLTSDFMRAELERSERELREQERQVSEFKERYRGELPTELQTNLSKLDRLTSQRQAVMTQLSIAETRLADMTQLGDFSSPTSAYSRLSALRAKLATEMAVNTDEHPNVIATRRQIEALEHEIAAGGGSMSGDPSQEIALRTAKQEVADLKTQLTRMAAESEELEAKVARTPEREEEMTALSQKVSVLQETYLSNLRKLQAAELSESVESAQQGARVQVLDRAVPPTEPERTRIKYLFAGLAASLLGACGLALLLELIDPVIVSAKQIETELGLAVLGSIGHIG